MRTTSCIECIACQGTTESPTISLPKGFSLLSKLSLHPRSENHVSFFLLGITAQLWGHVRRLPLLEATLVTKLWISYCFSNVSMNLQQLGGYIVLQRLVHITLSLLWNISSLQMTGTVGSFNLYRFVYTCNKAKTRTSRANFRVYRSTSSTGNQQARLLIC